MKHHKRLATLRFVAGKTIAHSLASFVFALLANHSAAEAVRDAIPKPADVLTEIVCELRAARRAKSEQRP